MILFAEALAAVVITAALPTLERLADKRYADRAAARKHDLAVKALAVKAGERQ
jgi:hypothetical protein